MRPHAGYAHAHGRIMFSLARYRCPDICRVVSCRVAGRASPLHACSSRAIIYIFIHQNMIERTEQKVQQKSTHKKEKQQQ